MHNVAALLPHQGILIQQLKHIFPNEETLVNTKKESNLKFPESTYLELDVWIPIHSLSFEFQDTYHYVTTWDVQKTRETIQFKDQTKKDIVHQQGITLVVVPVWWDGEVESLSSTIHFQRPDLTGTSHTDSLPISLNPPFGYFNDAELPDVGEFMLASFPLNSTSVSVPANTWWLGEKYDGIRCCWNPLKRRAYLRSGRELLLLPNKITLLPHLFVDGELWFGRGLFSYSYSLLKGIEFVQWDHLRIVSFDVPSKQHQSRGYEWRYRLLLMGVAPDHSFIVS